MILSIILFILILGIIVLIHEGGHFLFAKLTGVHVYEFSIGMGPLIFKRIAKDKTQYSIRAIPIGGYVSLAGEEVDEKARKKTAGHNLQDKTVIQRFLVMFAGVGFNFISAFFFLMIAGLVGGAPSTDPIISEVIADKPAQVAGIEAGDKVLKINNHKVTYFEDISLFLTIEDLDKPVTFKVEKGDGSVHDYKVSPILEEDKAGNQKYVIGIGLKLK